MAKTKQNLTWINVDTTTMKGDLAKRYQEVRKAFETVKAAKQAFEAEFTKVYEANVAKVPEGSELVFSHLRGLAVAVAPVAKSKSPVNAIRLTKAA